MPSLASADDRDTTTKVSGVISQIRSGLIFVAAPWGRMTIQSDALANAKVGDELTLWVSDNNVAVDHHAKGKEGVHRLITGKLTYTSGDKKEIKLMTPEGERSFPVQHWKSKLSTIEEGTPITVELNEAGNVIEIRKAG
jgi:TusA-related sulfurtransferase